MNRIYLYGIANATESYRVVRYSFIEGESTSIADIVREASWLKIKYPTISHVYAIDDKRGLAYEYKMTIKRNSVEGNVVFKDMLETEGLLII